MIIVRRTNSRMLRVELFVLGKEVYTTDDSMGYLATCSRPLPFGSGFPAVALINSI